MFGLISGGRYGQITTDVPVNIYAQPNFASAVVGTFMPGLIMVAASDPHAPWILLQEAVIDYATPDTAIVHDVGWVYQPEAAAAGGTIAAPETPWVPTGPITPFAGQGLITSIGNALASIGGALPSFGSGLLVVLALAGYLLIRGSGGSTIVVKR
jgi:hypothetical protein